MPRRPAVTPSPSLPRSATAVTQSAAPSLEEFLDTWLPLLLVLLCGAIGVGLTT